ncbi:pentatricopeptide repeat-containing protein At5g61370, mitochondrial-like [Zingiber officinale]|uniref:Pentatricopeptide repeat-containing protein n=1 Tax=Zingiber officinale TaxID=94328 RepID=A0A8J5HV44_ZINOF|nr:pentatricopeptide repeat-containing protein At5g61370, mitochondrial-like [Zingiber officinale]XP_042456956.1 pentatricopeptide repeat-containing protein At5g61370, mitochondrial-like [Zingiber officinale]XP_042456957.1 pentatricopeptide repeat-containing protein At5g61370, mitochondrial-like [Zingiber officinale]XP_042456959.1 pentatricopeptide repeat-containing protein At5g61370, mitochondrial-like [Zingiber officinale]XP_042456960.1 pentatricopeptide repeat-containing protein At5g61370, m
MARLLAFRGLVSSSSSSTPHLRHHHDSLVRIVALGVGSLDDMVAALDRSGVPVNQDSLNAVIDTCKSEAGDGGSGSGRRLLRFFSWCLPRVPQEHLGDDVFNRAIRAFAAMKDLTAMGIAISRLHEERRMMALETFTLVSDTLVKSGEEEDAVRLFRGLVRARLLQIPDGGGEGASRGLLVMVHALCARGHAGMARGVVWRHRRNLLSGGGEATRIIQQSLLHGWCVRGDVKEARHVMDEMKSLGFPPTIASYNDLLLCLCKKNVKSNPSALVPEATNLMTEMRTSGVPAATASFNILLSSLSRVRRAKEACRILYLMQQGEAECSPDWASYHIVIRLMYLTGRFVRGDRLLKEMLEAGLLPGASFYHSLVGLLCGLEKVDHALQLFDQMKRCGQYNAPTYELLIEKLSRSGRFEQATNLWEEATERNVILQCSRDLLDPSKAEVFKPVAAEKKLRSQSYSKVS